MMSICFILLLLISILTTSYGQVTCASGWVQNGGSCYLIGPVFNSGGQVGTWDQCNAYCLASYPGATMLCVNNAAENEWIRSQYASFYGWIWIGYTDLLPYGGGKGTKQYGWVTGCSSTYTNWDAGQPDNGANSEDHAVMHPGVGVWHDLRAPQEEYCGCEYNPTPTTTPSSGPTAAPFSSPSVAPSSGPTSSPTVTPSFRPSVGAVSE